jgi:predicted transcriptional regulator
MGTPIIHFYVFVHFLERQTKFGLDTVNLFFINYTLKFILRILSNIVSMKYRCAAEIIANILVGTLSGATKARIMMLAQINGIQSKRYLTYLLSERLIEKRSNTLYAATEKGRVFLEKYEKLRLEK